MPLLETVGSGSAKGFGLTTSGEYGSLSGLSIINSYGGVTGITHVYTADSWDPANKIWFDLSGNKNNATEIWQGENIVKSTSYSNQNGVNKSFTTLHAAANGGIRFPQSLNLDGNYTLFHVARRYGQTSGGNEQSRGRIFDGLGDNWLSGFWGGYSGVAYHNGWLTQFSSDTHVNNWVLSTDQLSLYRSNSVTRGTSGNGTVSPDTQLSLHNGNYTSGGSERSTWVAAEVVYYNRQLNSTEYQAVENALKSKYGFTY